jgi:predicted DNA-binding protein YlxM (UPF0122 family)
MTEGLKNISEADQLIQDIKIACQEIALMGPAVAVRRFIRYLFEGLSIKEIGQCEKVSGTCVSMNLKKVLWYLRLPKYKVSLTYKQLKALQGYIYIKECLDQAKKPMGWRTVPALSDDKDIQF